MGSNDSKLCYNHIPFLDNGSPTQIERKIDRCDPLYGPSLMPYKVKDFCRDAIGRPIVVDGIGCFGRFSRNSILSRVFIHNVSINTNYSIGRVLWYTDVLNEVMCNLDFEALWAIDSHNVAIYTHNPSHEFAKRSITTIGIEETIASLDDGPNRPTEDQLIEGIERMEDSFNKYGVGALIKYEEGFKYRILVPNEHEYMKFQEKYDEIETNLKKAKYNRIEKKRKATDDLHHAKTKCTRSGKNFDDGSSDALRVINKLSKWLELKIKKRNAVAYAAIKRTRSGKTYDDGLDDALRVVLKREKREKREKRKELAAANAVANAVANATANTTDATTDATGVNATGANATSANATGATGAAGAVGTGATGAVGTGAAGDHDSETVEQPSNKKARTDNGNL